ncbi:MULTISPECIES: hypothetical protein [Bradyrhizobium]|uniref:hypothetical protein n=1 Tax=Bradyrhizobium TaxID=374 RepID=UPI001144B10F|nr:MULTISPECIES: hypothetical protein [Bradyrhizobium]QOG21556.1 hypothetical protein FOM02_33900 [Bradyrhizobium sp. SEMIA]UFW51996.1 hypothetical protein BaraCB756_13870 [Bradyrhizobium arachidis]
MLHRDGHRGDEAKQGGQGSHAHHHARAGRDLLDRRPVDGLPAQQQIGRVHQGEYAGAAAVATLRSGLNSQRSAGRKAALLHFRGHSEQLSDWLHLLRKNMVCSELSVAGS